MPITVALVGKFVFMVAMQYVMSGGQERDKKELAAPWESLEYSEADLGSPIPVVFGTRWVSNPNVVWYGDLLSKPVKVPVS